MNIVIDSTRSAADNVSSVLSQLPPSSVFAVVHTAGGWRGGSIDATDLLDSVAAMCDINITSAVCAGHVASRVLQPGGLLVFTGALAATRGTPGMVAYGMSKAATHQLARSLAADSSGLPERCTVATVLPVTIDTPANRQWLSAADAHTWTPPEFIADTIVGWAKHCEAKASGSAGPSDSSVGAVNGGFYSFITAGGATRIEQIKSE